MASRVQQSSLAPKEVARLGEVVVRDIPDAVIYADRQGVIRYWNAGAERIFGFAGHEALGRSLDIIIPARLRERHWTGFDRMMETGQSQYGADTLLAVPAESKSGAKLSIQFTAAPVYDGGTVSGIVAVLRDVTADYQERKRLRELAGAPGAS